MIYVKQYDMIWYDMIWHRQLKHAVKSQLAVQRHGWYSLVFTHPCTSHQLLCVQCEFVCTACLVFIIAAHLGNEVIVLLVITADTTGHSKLLHCPTSHLTSFCARDHIDSRNKSLKYRRRWGREPVTSSVAGECVSHSATVNRHYEEYGVLAF